MTRERTRVKICGIKDAESARVAADAGADAVGLVFYRASPRYVTPAAAAAIAASLPPYVMAVGLFVDSPREEVERTLAAVPLDLLQFQGDEPPEFCAGFARPFVRAVRMEAGTDLIEYARRFSRAKALLLDAHVPGQPGGTGRTFDWAGIPRDFPLPLILSGGLTVQNVGRAVREVRPWAVDVSSGVERERGVKDPAKIIDFIRSVRREDAGQSA
jgi:phosphoribosylanthranilate isomerase